MNRDTVLQIINQQKDKMTSEQLWCVVLLSGAFGALILNSSDIASRIPAWAVYLALLPPGGLALSGAGTRTTWSYRRSSLNWPPGAQTCRQAG